MRQAFENVKEKFKRHVLSKLKKLIERESSTNEKKLSRISRLFCLTWYVLQMCPGLILGGPPEGPPLGVWFLIGKRGERETL